jgi:type VI secretion system protein ImpH
LEEPGLTASPKDGGPDLRAVREEFRERPTAFGLFQALRLLERMAPDRTPVGGFGDPREEVARLSQNPRLSFPPSEIQEAEVGGDGDAVRIRANVRGLVGAMGVLPHPYSMLVLERIRERDRALADFLDIFHHRFLSLFYAAWRRARPELAWERGDEDTLLHHLHDLVGAGHEPEGAVSLDGLGWYMGLLASPSRSAAALEQILSDRFSTPVRVEPFVGGWLSLGEEDLCRLGEEGMGDILGSAVVGDEVWDPHARIRIRMGPLDREAYDRLLPGRTDHDALKRLVRFFTRDELQVEVRLVLARDEVPATVLGGEEGRVPALGWGTWLRSGPRTRDADETTLTL